MGPAMDVRMHGAAGAAAAAAAAPARRLPDGYGEVAAGMERQFARHLIEQMDRTVGRAGPGSAAGSYYRSLLHDEVADRMAREGSLGVRDMVLEAARAGGGPWRR